MLHKILVEKINVLSIEKIAKVKLWSQNQREESDHNLLGIAQWFKNDPKSISKNLKPNNINKLTTPQPNQDHHLSKQLKIKQSKS
jgi:hypothetical protein